MIEASRGRGIVDGREREGELTASDEVVEERLLALEEIFIQHSFPIISILNELVLEEVDVRSLISGVAQVVAPVVLGDLAGRLSPWF